MHARQARETMLVERLTWAGAPPILVATLVVRGQEVLLYRLSSAGSDYVRSLYELARDAELAGQDRQAYERWATACDGDPSSASYLAYARAARRVKEFTRALSASQEAVSRAPSSSRAWLERGRALAATGRPEEAREATQQAWRLEPTRYTQHQVRDISGQETKVPN
jgi:Flp pilus assembly protein TadD